MSDLSIVVTVIALALGMIIWVVMKGIETVLTRQQDTLQQSASTTLADMFIFLDPQKMFRYNVAAMVVLPIVVWVITVNPIFTLTALIVAYFAPKWYVRFLAARRLKLLEKQLPDALLMITGAMSAGASLNVAIDSMIKEQRPPIAQEFELMAREQRMGVDFDTALRNMEKRNPLADFALVIAALRISREIGGNLAEILNSLADTLREKQTMEGKIASLTAQGKIQGVVMTSLPLLVMFGLTQIEPVAMAPLFSTWIGWGTLSVIIVMEVMGYFFIRKITSIDVEYRTDGLTMNANTTVALGIGLLVGISVMLFFMSLRSLKSEVPSEDREYMDPLPPLLRIVWPLITFIEFHLTQRFPPDWLESTHKKLQETGVGYLMSAEQFYAVRVFGGVFTAFLWFLLAALETQDFLWVLIGGVGGYYFPLLWLRDVAAKRRKDVLRALPVYLDFITMAVEAGLNLNGALNQAMDKGPAGPLRNEFYMVVRDLRAGVPRADALRRMEKRLNLAEITSFVGTVIQAEKMGARLGSALRIQSMQRRTERFQRAEKLAMEAPVKLILPLIVFIFPVTFIVLAFPIVMKFMMEGML